MADNTKTKVLTLKTELDPSGIKSGADLIRSEVSKLTTDIGKFMGTIQKSINAALDPLSTAAADLTALGNSYTNSLKQMSIASTTAKGSIDGINKSITSMSTRSKNLVGNMTSAAGAVKLYADASKGINSASISFRNYGDTVSNSMKLVNGQFDQATRLVRSAKNDIMDLGRIFVMTTAAMVTAVALPTKAFGDFEKELLTLKNLANDFTKGELETFKKTALDVAYANGLMAKDIAASGIELVRLGLNAKETNSVLRLVADAALANSISIVKAAEVGLGATKAMGLGVKDLSMVLDVLTRAAVSSATDIEGLSQTFKYAAPIFNSAEQDIKELGKASIILSNNMIRNSQAGTTLRSMMLAFQAPTVQAQKAMKILGLEIQDTTTGKIKPFTQIVQEMSEKLKGVDTATKNFTLSTIFGKYALSGATALINSNTKAYEDADKAINDTTLSNEKMAAGMRQGVNFEFNRMRASINNSAIALGENLAPAVVEILQSITNLSEGFMNLPSSMQQSIADMTILTGKVTIATSAIVGLVLAGRTLINFGKEMLAIFGFTGWLASFGAAVTAVKMSIASLSLSIAALTGGAASAGTMLGVSVVGFVGLAVGALWGLRQIVVLLNENWELFKANLAEEKAWEVAVDGAKRLEESLLDAEKAARKLKNTQDAAANKKSTMTPLEIRRAASDRLKNLKGKNMAGDPYQDPQYLALMEAARSTGVYEKAKEEAAKKSALQVGLDPNSPTAKALKASEQAQIDIMAKQRKILEKAGLLGEEENLVMTAEIEARNKSLKGLQTESADKEAERQQRKVSSANLKKVEDDIEDILKKQRQDYQDRRKKSLQQIQSGESSVGGGEAVYSAALDFVKSGAADEFAKLDTEGLFAVGRACDFATAKFLELAGANKEVLSVFKQTGYNVPDTIKLLEKMGAITEVSYNQAGVGDLFTPQDQSHIGLKGPNNMIIHSGNTPGRNWGAKNNAGQKINQRIVEAPNYLGGSGRYYKWNTDMLGASGGVSRENQALQATQQEKKDAQDSLQMAINMLKKKMAFYKTDQEEYKAYSDKIAALEALKADASNDALKKEIQAQEEARKKMETIYDENAKSLLNTQQEIDRKRAEMSKTTLTQKYNEIEENYAAEVASYKVRFGAYKEFEALKKQADEKRKKELIKLGLEEQAAFTQMLEDQTDARKKMMGTENQAKMYDLQKDIMLLEKRRAQQVGDEADKNKQLIDALIKGKKDELKVTKEQVQTDLVLYLNEQKLLRLQNDLAHAQNDLNSGKITQFEYDNISLNLADEKFRAAKRELENAQARTDLNESERTKREADAKQKLTDAEIEYNAAVNNGLGIQLKKIRLDRDRGVTSDFDAQLATVKALDDQLNKMKPTDVGYNKILADRNELMLKNAAAQGDMSAVFEAYALKLAGVKNLSQIQVKLFGDMAVTGEQVKMGFGMLTESAGKLGQALANSSEIIGGLLDKMSGLASGMSKVIMGMISGNPVQVIAGLVEGLAGLIDALNGAKKAENEAVTSWLAYKESLIQIEDQAQKTETRLRLLRGEITELQAAIDDQTTDRQTKEKKLAGLKEKELALKKKIQDNFAGFGPFTFVVDQKSYLQNYKDLEANQAAIKQLEKDLQADSLENAQTNNEAKKELYLTDLDNFWATQKERAKLTKETLDDVKAEFMANLSARRAQMQTEVDDARKKGLDVKTLEEKHAAELASLWAQYAVDEADAKAKDAESTLTAEEERNKKIEEERQEHLKKLYDMERQSAVDLLKAKASATFDKDDDIRADAEAERKAAGDRYQGIIEQVTGNSELEMKIKRQALQTYLIEVEQADKKEVRLLAENSKEKVKAARDVALIQAQNSRDTTAILRQELSNQFADLQDWKDKEIALANGDADRLIDIEKEFAAKRVQIQRGAEDKIRDSAVSQLNEIKSIREEILKTQSMQYEDTIRQQEGFLLDLNKQRDDLQRQIEFYDNQIAKKTAQFNKDDKTLFKGLLKDVDIPAEIRAGLDLIANPTGVPNNRFSRNSQREAIKERIDLLTLENENLRDLEDRTSTDYWKEESRIALIQAATANDLLTNSVTSTKLTAKEKAEIQKEMAEGYKRYQAAQIELIQDQYKSEREVADASLLQNKMDQEEKNKLIADSKYQLDLLTQTYQKDISLIDKEVLSLNMAHHNMKIGIDEVKNSLGNMSPLIEQVRASYIGLNSAMTAASSAAFPQGASKSASSLRGPKNVGQSAPAGYPITDGNYWYESNSKMWEAQSLGLKDGGIVGMIPNQDRFKGDKFPIMPGVNGDAGELLVSPLSKLAEIMPSGNNYSILVTGNEFRDEVDFKRVLMDFGREQDLRNSMSTGQFYSNLRR